MYWVSTSQKYVPAWWHNSASTPGQSELYRTKADTPLLNDFFWALFVKAALSHLCFVLEAGQLLVSVIRVEKKPRHLRTRLKSHPLYRFGKKFDPTLPHKEVQQHPTTEQMVHRLVQAAGRDEEGLIVNVASRYAHISTYTCKRLQISYHLA